MLQPKGLLYYPQGIGRKAVEPAAVLKAMRKTVRIMLAPVPIAGVRGMRMLAIKVAALPVDAKASAAYIGHIVRMQEEIGTGGAGFRFIYAAFLQEAAAITGNAKLGEFSGRLTAIGDVWRLFALKAARMIKGREALVPAALAEQLRELAQLEECFFRDLKLAVR